ncbi:MAG: hypothetical protein LBN05_08840 [Oscillospiraceae bacterium]|jgi:hypothetical protein|nr:hypothetical protein [Oscillospiraceae bacterium]
MEEELLALSGTNHLVQKMLEEIAQLKDDLAKRPVQNAITFNSNQWQFANPSEGYYILLLDKAKVDSILPDGKIENVDFKLQLQLMDGSFIKSLSKIIGDFQTGIYPDFSIQFEKSDWFQVYNGQYIVLGVGYADGGAPALAGLPEGLALDVKVSYVKGAQDETV